jgi:hypothetical protein
MQLRFQVFENPRPPKLVVHCLSLVAKGDQYTKEQLDAVASATSNALLTKRYFATFCKWQSPILCFAQNAANRFERRG